LSFQFKQFDQALRLLSGRLSLIGDHTYNLVVCGGTALVATGLIMRATRDVDIVAMVDADGNLIDPAPLPAPLVEGAKEVAEDLGLPEDWLNNGPSSGEGGLFRMGLPDGFLGRLTWKTFGSNLKVGFIGRYDQIHFKLYAAVDQMGSYHATDLQALEPTEDELLAAASWSRSHDPSDGYLQTLRWFLKEFGYERIADQV
jgi:hypothetical protein